MRVPGQPATEAGLAVDACLTRPTGYSPELYTKAVEQLGSDQAPVRFSGLYALERLAQDNPAHRQAIVNVICAYLRMPFSPTAPASKREPVAAEGRKEPGTQSETGPMGWARMAARKTGASYRATYSCRAPA